MQRSVEVELNPVYLAEARRRYRDLEAQIRDIVGWVLIRVAIAQGRGELRTAFDELENETPGVRARVGWGIRGAGAARPVVWAWRCDDVSAQAPAVGARYQVAGAESRLGTEARRSNRLPEAVDFAKEGISVVADLPPQAVTANLYFNLGVALEGRGEVAEAIEAFEDAAEIDAALGREPESAWSRQSIKTLRGRIDGGGKKA